MQWKRDGETLNAVQVANMHGALDKRNWPRTAPNEYEGYDEDRCLPERIMDYMCFLERQVALHARRGYSHGGPVMLEVTSAIDEVTGKTMVYVVINDEAQAVLDNPSQGAFCGSLKEHGFNADLLIIRVSREPLTVSLDDLCV